MMRTALTERAEPALGAILVGGESRRMGADKALVSWRGRTLLEHAAECLSAALPEVVVVGGDVGAHGVAGYRVLADREPGLGPLGGLATALDHAAGRPVFALACDLPRATSELVEHLLGLAGGAEPGSAAAWVPRAEGRLQPLCALYTAACAAPLDDYLAGGERRAIEFLERVTCRVVELEPDNSLFRPGLLANVNRPEDLEALDAKEVRATPPGSSRRLRVTTVGDAAVAGDDLVAAEEPMEARVVAEVQGRRSAHPLAVTMRTPGHDFELTAGFLLSEGVVEKGEDLWRLAYCLDTEESARNIVEAHLAPGVDFDPERFRRNVYMTSSCGVCGKASIERLETACPRRPEHRFRVDGAMLKSLPTRLGGSQTVFSQTGGLHAAGLFSPKGELLRLREDVGRHNALDKLIGSYLLEGVVPLSDAVLLVSGRASFELVQKALIAGIPILAAVGAPSTLAVETAKAWGQTLIGFLRQDRFNVYTGEDRLLP